MKYCALILGASSGFGAATARKLSKDGYNIIGVHLDRSATMPIVEKIIQDIQNDGNEAHFFNINAADHKKREHVIEEIKKITNNEPLVRVVLHSLAFGSLQPFIALNKGGEFITHRQIEMTLDVMANSLVYWTQDLVHNDLMPENSRIFALTSFGSRVAFPFYGAVSAAKAALEAYVRQLALELGKKKIAVNALMAGVTDTPALRKIRGNNKIIELALEKNPMGRLTVPEDIANAISVLSKPEAIWINGGVIQVDGGEDAISFANTSVL
ncbi:MAG TPA: SDR family oxidoreductase [Ignavibacteriales bacterium]|nr:SDR family oxidoreductase [Ignavibacteriales bacterium]HOL80428.1 SDR family oxidoreductase [Ignavibacteriales bacterium]HPP32617.1 SDR family oxidoreductase [Ignavibacteriales bacterium]